MFSFATPKDKYFISNDAFYNNDTFLPIFSLVRLKGKNAFFSVIRKYKKIINKRKRCTHLIRQ